MKKTIKTEEILKLFNIISNAKYGKMDDAGKIALWKLTRKLKPIAEKFEADTKDAAEKMKPFEDFDEKLHKAQQFENAKRDNKPTEEIMREADYNDFLKSFKEYQDLINKAIKEFADKDVEIDYDTISEDSFGQLMASNDWDMKTTMIVGDLIVSDENATAAPAETVEMKPERGNRRNKK